jgi:hypothetical protein
MKTGGTMLPWTEPDLFRSRWFCCLVLWDLILVMAVFTLMIWVQIHVSLDAGTIIWGTLEPGQPFFIKISVLPIVGSYIIWGIGAFLGSQMWEAVRKC